MVVYFVFVATLRNRTPTFVSLPSSAFDKLIVNALGRAVEVSSNIHVSLQRFTQIVLSNHYVWLLTGWLNHSGQSVTGRRSVVTLN